MGEVIAGVGIGFFGALVSFAVVDLVFQWLIRRSDAILKEQRTGDEPV